MTGLLQRVVEHSRVVDCVDELRAQHGDFLAEVGMLRVVGVLARDCRLWCNRTWVRNGVHAIAFGLGLGEFRQLGHRNRAGDFLGHGGQGAQA